MYLTCEGIAGAEVGGEGLVVDGFPHDPVILIIDVEGGRVGLKYYVKWQVAWKLTANFTEIHIADRKLIFTRGLFEGTITLAYISGCGVFAEKKETIKGDNK